MNTPFTQRIWRFCCSLKLAIVLASLITLLSIYGSLVMHAIPRLFGDIDQHPLLPWMGSLPADQWDKTWWLYLCGVLLLGFSLNTLCCFIDWLTKIRYRWRKTGEYLIHLGFVLVVIAFALGSLKGARQDSVRLYLKQPHALPGLPGLELIVDDIEPVLNQQGRPLDMLNRVRVVKGETLLAAEQVSINQPLLYGGLVVVPVSFGQQAQGFDCFMVGSGNVRLVTGATLTPAPNLKLRVLDFYPDAQRTGNDQVIRTGEQLGNPALQLELTGAGIPDWTGWYFLREQLPYPLLANGVSFWPVSPVFNRYTVLTMNYDPGAGIALAGGICFLLGTLLAMISFYRKRRVNDRPEL